MLAFPCTSKTNQIVLLSTPPPLIERSAEAVLSEGNVEPYLPNEWTEEEASVLAHLVGLYGPTNWAIIAAGVATKSETQVRSEDRIGRRKDEEERGRAARWSEGGRSLDDPRVALCSRRWAGVRAA